MMLDFVSDKGLDFCEFCGEDLTGYRSVIIRELNPQEKIYYCNLFCEENDIVEHVELFNDHDLIEILV